MNVSPVYVVGLLARGEIPFDHSSGSTKVNKADAVSFKRRDYAQRKRVLDELTAEAETHRLGY